jgi:hypothetical protein
MGPSARHWEISTYPIKEMSVNFGSPIPLPIPAGGSKTPLALGVFQPGNPL